LISHGAFRNDKKHEAIVPETIKKRLESYPGWSDLVRLRQKRAQYTRVQDNDVMTDGGTTGGWIRKTTRLRTSPIVQHEYRSPQELPMTTHTSSHDHFVYSDVNDVQQTSDSAFIDI